MGSKIYRSVRRGSKEGMVVPRLLIKLCLTDFTGDTIRRVRRRDIGGISSVARRWAGALQRSDYELRRTNRTCIPKLVCNKILVRVPGLTIQNTFRTYPLYQTQTQEFLTLAGCDKGDNETATFTCLRALPVDTIKSASSSVYSKYE